MIKNNLKKCRVCKLLLSLEKFNKDCTTTDGFKNLCKICRTNYEQSPHGKYLEYRKKAKKRNILFNISEIEFLEFWKKPCFYCNYSIKTIGLDRVDNEKGYYLYNVVPCCRKCNYLKRAFSMDDLKRMSMIFSKLESR